MAKRGLTFPPYPNGQYAGKSGPVTPGMKTSLDSDAVRTGSANNTGKDRPNSKKFKVGMK